MARPAQPRLDIPTPADLPPIAMPPQAQMTPADKTDPTPPPPSGLMTGPPATVSPGAQKTEKIVFPVDVGSSRIPASATTALDHVADVLRHDTEARVEVRSFTASRPNNEGNARRLALARFFAVRELLIADGVANKRIDGRPLISASDELNADRIELYIELTPTRPSR
jgi:outer membrane protein OmpA-like peptidoglycan-associated protein